MKCDFCRSIGEDRAAVSAEGQEWGFCSVACMVLFVRSTYIEVRS